MSQIKVRQVTANAIMSSRAFAAGVEDAIMGLPIDDNWSIKDGSGAAFRYEYGRIWQVATRQGQPKMVRRIVLQAQQELFKKIYWDGTIPPKAGAEPTSSALPSIEGTGL